MTKKEPMTAAERQKKRRMRQKERRQRLENTGRVEVTLALSQTQLAAINRFARLTRILPDMADIPDLPDGGLSTEEALQRLANPALDKFEEWFSNLEEKHAELFAAIEALRDSPVSRGMTDAQFLLDQRKDRVWRKYMKAPVDSPAATALLREHAKLQNELADSMGWAND